LSETFSEKLGVVMLDVWQVACAIELHAKVFWTFDRDQESSPARRPASNPSPDWIEN
jgi:hypothetical protein